MTNSRFVLLVSQQYFFYQTEFVLKLVFGQSRLRCRFIISVESDQIGREAFSFPFSYDVPFVSSVHLWVVQQV